MTLAKPMNRLAMGAGRERILQKHQQLEDSDNEQSLTKNNPC